MGLAELCAESLSWTFRFHFGKQATARLAGRSCRVRQSNLALAVAHNYRAAGWPLLKRLLKNGRGLVMDIKGVLDPLQAPTGVENWRL